MITKKQVMAKKAYDNITTFKGKSSKNDIEKYSSFCLSFPAILHSYGLCQALAFAEAKGHEDYLEHLKDVLSIQNLTDRSRNDDVINYQKLSRETLEGATWLKRYTEAFLD